LYDVTDHIIDGIKDLKKGI